MAERILPTKAQAPASIPHAYNDPSLSPIEFLTAVYRDTHLPMASRIQAASALLPFTNPAPRPVVQGHVPYRCKIIIGGLGPCDPAHGSPDDPTTDRSENLLSSNKTLARDDEAVDFQNLTTIPEPSTFIDFSTPPIPAELQEIKAAINRLRSDLAHLPTPELHLCPCGHWIAGEYDCCRALSSRDGSKLN